jgi:hypothetical protein
MPAFFRQYSPYLLALLVAAFVSVQRVQGSETVTATVTAQEVSLSVSDGTVAYGILALEASQDTTGDGLNDTQTVTNTGNVTADFTINGQNSSPWTLAGSIGADQYMHQFSIDDGTAWTALTTSPQSLSSGVAPDGTTDLDLKITLPTSTSSYDEQSVDVTVQVSAS